MNKTAVLLLGSLLAGLLSIVLPADQMQHWGRVLPFLVAAPVGLLANRTFGCGHSFGVLSHYYGREAGPELREDIDTVLEPGIVVVSWPGGHDRREAAPRPTWRRFSAPVRNDGAYHDCRRIP